MPSANALALKALLEEMWDAWIQADPIANSHEPVAESFATDWLASRSVLAVSDAVLTDEVCERIWKETASPEYGRDADGNEHMIGYEYGRPEEMRHRLAQLAKGE